MSTSAGGSNSVGGALGASSGGNSMGGSPNVPSAGGTNNTGGSSVGAGGASPASGGSAPIILTDFPMRRKLTLPAAQVSDGLTDFPVLVSLPAGTISAEEGGANGEVVRFADAQGLPLQHEIEVWDPAGRSTIWVRLSDLKAATANGFYVYYGNPNVAALPANHGENVWSDTFAAVWHFSDRARDSTSHHFNGADVQAAFATGHTGQAILLDNADPNHGDLPPTPQYVMLAKQTSLVDSAAGATVSAWVRHKGPVDSNQAIVLGVGTHDTDGHLSRISMALSTDLGVIGEFNADESNYEQNQTDGGVAPNDAWHYITVVGDIAGKKISVYVDGARLGNPLTTQWAPAMFPSTPSDRIVIGGEEDLSHGFFDGSIDELRVERTARSADWIAAQAKATAPDYVTIGPAMVP